MNLTENTFKPYLKPNDNPLYVHSLSNHPKSILKNIPEAVNRRLSALSSDEKMFTEVAPSYQEALKKSGYNFKLEFNPTNDNPEQKNRNRARKSCGGIPHFQQL